MRTKNKSRKTTNPTEGRRTDGEGRVVDSGADKTTRSDVGSEANPAVDATRVNSPFSTNDEGKGLTADNAVELMTENEVAKRNREVANWGTERERTDGKNDGARG